MKSIIIFYSITFLAGIIALPLDGSGQADNEIQVYASPTIGHKRTIFELHNNYTFNGPKNLVNPADFRFTNHTLEITHGLGDDFEIGFYTFTSISNDGRFQYLGNQIRPRVTVPKKWGWKFGASLSMEIGFFRPGTGLPFRTQGELRPIVDRTWGKFYVAINPNIDFVLSGTGKEVGISPQAKVVYTIGGKFGLGVEYYSGLGTFSKLSPMSQQEHLIGPIFDLYTNPDWELQTGFLFGLTQGSNQQLFKLLVGRRIKWK